MDVTLEQVKEFFTEKGKDDDVVDFLGTLVEPPEITETDLKTYLETEKGKKFLQPRLDKAVTKGIETFKDKTLLGLVDEEIKKRYPEETPEQKELRELKDRLNKKEQDEARQKQVNLALEIANEKKLSGKFIEKLIGDSDEATRAALEEFAEYMDEHKKLVINETLGEHGKPPQGGGPGGGGYSNYEQWARDYNSSDIEIKRKAVKWQEEHPTKIDEWARTPNK